MTKAEAQPESHADASPTPQEPVGALLGNGSTLRRRKVTVDIACVKCGYNIKGIDPLDRCPECGFEVRRTLLFVVDPSSSTISALRKPRQLGLSLILVALFLAIAAFALWLPSILYVATLISARFEIWQTRLDSWWSPLSAIILIVTTGCMMFLFRRPTLQESDQEYRKGLSKATTGLFAWAGFIAAIAFYDNSNALEWQDRYAPVQADNIDVWRTVLRLGAMSALFLVVSGLHPVITFLGRRSVYHRIVQISRQGFRAMLLAVIITGIGDSVRLLLGIGEDFQVFIPYKDVIILPSLMLSLVGSGMMTLALWNALVDCIRLSREMTRRRYSIDQIVSGNASNHPISHE